MIKKLIFSAIAILSVPALLASAATPILNVSGTGTNNASVHVSGADINSPVSLYYFTPSTGIYQAHTLGTTNASGTFSGFVDTALLANFGANFSMPLYVTVNGYESARVMWPSGTVTSSGNITFSNSSPVVAVGGTGSITLSGGNGSYYILNNSNTNGVSASISGNTLNLYGSANGMANITVCSTNGGCGTFTTTVQGTGAPTLSSSNITVGHGGQGSVTLSGGSGPYTVSMLSGTGVSTTLIGNTLYVNGNATGTNMLNICSSNGTCSQLAVNVQAQASGNTGTNTNTGTTGGISLSLPLTVGQSLQLGLTGNGSGSYYIQSPVSSPALASISGNTLMLNGSVVGSGTVTVCQAGGSCLPIRLSVSPSSQLTGTGGGHLFMSNLGVGASGQDVVELQTRLKELGYFHANITGYFGGNTKAAVQKYQRDHGISATGFVGVQTRASLNR